jgi:hypothetical protein
MPNRTNEVVGDQSHGIGLILTQIRISRHQRTAEQVIGDFNPRLSTQHMESRRRNNPA